MRILPFLLAVVASLLISCSQSPDAPVSDAPVITPSTPGGSATATPSVEAPPTPSPTPLPPVVQIEFPAWVDESSQMANLIATSDVIAEARFLSVDASTMEHESYGLLVELIYQFRAIRYLKGEGPDELTVRMNSGPKYIAFPDWLGKRTEAEAEGFAKNWMDRSRSLFADRGEGILFLSSASRSSQGKSYSFVSFLDGEGHGDYPIIGETWLDESEDSIYVHKLTGREDKTISFAELEALIEDMRRITDGWNKGCVLNALHFRNRVRAQIEGTYKELTIGGYVEPDPFQQVIVSMDTGESEHRPVWESLRPPYRSPRFSHYWLDGPDRDLFAIYADEDSEASYEVVRPVKRLPPGQYNIYYSQYHTGQVCNNFTWWDWDTTELLVVINAEDEAER